MLYPTGAGGEEVLRDEWGQGDLQGACLQKVKGAREVDLLGGVTRKRYDVGRTGELANTGSQAAGGGPRIPGSSFKVGEENVL